ncbi:MAG: alpha-mannosyltransferase [Chloroflexi bacterium]|nr:alpha-mannosyltransferase [Chloroflexota bacterium]|tara:strand:- start:520 stop:1536 length:1017 start_codon:yes stop_codon:yes gene_type:complete
MQKNHELRMKIILVTDTWHPQVNGVVRTYENVIEYARSQGNYEFDIIDPSQFTTAPLPKYPEVKMVIQPWKIGGMLKNSTFDAIHIATEGPLGIAARIWCNKEKVPYTTAYHTRFPEYFHQYHRVPKRIGYRYINWFHKKSDRIFVPTEAMKQELEKNHIDTSKVIWPRGVNKLIFNPSRRRNFSQYPRPIWLYAGRVSVEKNVEEFLKLPINGTKIVVGDGPNRQVLQSKYSDAIFTGYKYAEELAEYYASADVFVFPSKTDTFGVVILEAMSCGTPTIAFDVSGPKDIINSGISGYYSNNLLELCNKALLLNRQDVANDSVQWTWEKVAEIFLANI